MGGVNALLTTVALTLALAFTLTRLYAATNPLRLLVYLPLLAGACERLENALLLAMVSSFPTEATAAGGLAGPATSAKLIVGFATLPIAVLSFVALGVKALRGRREPRAEG